MRGQIAVITAGNAVRTIGLGASAGFELELYVSERGLLDACGNLALCLADYFATSSKAVHTGDRVDWASSLLVVQRLTGAFVTLDELRYDGKTVTKGVDQCVSIWSEQSRICEENGSRFMSCRYGDKIAVSPDVLDRSEDIEGVRYPARAPMSGWWLFTQSYDGSADDFRSMTPMHVFHVLDRRPDLATYFGLDVGYAFRSRVSGGRTEHRVWYESEVAHQSSP